MQISLMLECRTSYGAVVEMPETEYKRLVAALESDSRRTVERAQKDLVSLASADAQWTIHNVTCVEEFEPCHEGGPDSEDNLVVPDTVGPYETF